MSSATTDAPPARLKTRYLEEIRPSLMDRFGYSSVMQAPRVEKITLNMGVGGAKQDSKVLKAATEQLATIAGQAPSVRRARKSIAAFKLREGNPVGVAVTLRSERAYEFLDRLVSIAIPRIRDFRGLNPRSFDGRGNYSMGVREQIIFPEIDYDAIDEVRGLDITISTSARTDPEAFALLLALGMPFATQGRPRDFEDPNAPAASGPEGAAEAEEAEPEPAAETEPEPAAETEPEPAAEAEPEPAAEAEPEPEDVEPETADAEAEPDAETDAEALPSEAEASDGEPAAEAAEADAEAPPAESGEAEVEDAEPEAESSAAEAEGEDASAADAPAGADGQAEADGEGQAHAEGDTADEGSTA
jgi:large subunit ribosomal protein L5